MEPVIQIKKLDSETWVEYGTSGSQTRTPYFVNETLYAHATSSPMSTWAEFEFNDDTLTVTVKYYASGQENTYYSWGIRKQAG